MRAPLLKLSSEVKGVGSFLDFSGLAPSVFLEYCSFSTAFRGSPEWTFARQSGSHPQIQRLQSL